MSEFHLYFKDGDEAHAAEKRVARYGDEIKTPDDVRTDLRDFLGGRFDADEMVGVAREYQQRLREHQAVTVAWPASYDDMGWELILEADSIEDVQAFVGVDLDYTWEAG